ncbi:MAG: MBL fold metallo-hydrolase, partial [Actinomycetota bacterium]|nr:MBL fold metallo-hydrolase [Actinomycetota bacterium]
MDTRIDEITEGIYRISSHTDHGPPGGFVFNQFL